ncbi:winged helix-turn-helix transcriptional regulator [bacterium]|nr:winged helix-turn-helix transcriptional regulator [bacterium]
MRPKPEDIFKALSVKTRLLIIQLLKSEGPIGAKKIAEALNITTAAVSQHLKILKQVGLVNSERQGYFIPYDINLESLENCRCMINEVCTCVCHQNDDTCDCSEETLEDLIEYKKRLEKELERVKNKIDQLEK